jgi:uncharacterized delta-60 repeat protein
LCGGRFGEYLKALVSQSTAALRENQKRWPNSQSLNGKQGTELADLIVHKITEAVNAISFKQARGGSAEPLRTAAARPDPGHAPGGERAAAPTLQRISISASSESGSGFDYPTLTRCAGCETVGPSYSSGRAGAMAFRRRGIAEKFGLGAVVAAAAWSTCGARHTRRVGVLGQTFAFLAAALLLAAFPRVANAAAGDLDPSFSGNGIATYPGTGASSVAVDSKGRIVVLADYEYLVLRFLPNGTLDKSFSGDGRAPLPIFANSVATDARNRVVFAGALRKPGDRVGFAVGRLKANGARDRSFSGDGKAWTPIGAWGKAEAYGVAIDPQGRIVAAGSHYAGGYRFAVARYLPDGRPDASFSGDGQTETQFPNAEDASGLAVATDSQGRIIVAGYATGDLAVARYTHGGNLDPSFSEDGRLTTAIGGYATAVAIDGFDRIVVAGGAKTGDETDFALARYNPNGALDTAFSGDGMVLTSFGQKFSWAGGVAIDGHQRIVAAGETGERGYGPKIAVARYTPSGALDPAFSGDGRVTTGRRTGPGSRGEDVSLDSKGRIVVAGVWKEDTAVVRYLSR